MSAAVVSALVRMRVHGFVRTGRALTPLITTLLVLGVVQGGGAAPAGEAYGVSAVVLFPVLAWQSKLLLDTEPDVQRRLASVTVGARRELLAGLLAAALLGLVTIVLGLVVPWLVGAIRGPRPGEPGVLAGIVLGGWGHLLALLAAVALGALASRAVTGSVLRGVAVLTCGAVGALVFGLKWSVLWWLVPPLMATARALPAGPAPAELLGLSGHAAAWTAVALAGYARLRRTRG